MANEIIYIKGKVVVDQQPKDGQNLLVYARPGDEIDLNLPGLDLENIEKEIIGGDLVIALPNGGQLTFVSMALMGYTEQSPIFKSGGKNIPLDVILSDINEINNVPLDAILLNDEIEIPEDALEEEEIVEEESPPEQQQAQMLQILQEIQDQTKKSDNDFSGNFDEEPVEQVEILPVISTDDFATPATQSDAAPSEIEGLKPELLFDIDIGTYC